MKQMKASHVLLFTDTSGSFIKLLLRILDIYYELLDHMSVPFLGQFWFYVFSEEIKETNREDGVTKQTASI